MLRVEGSDTGEKGGEAQLKQSMNEDAVRKFAAL